MRRIVITSATVLCCIITGWSQAYYEASGQTTVFTLAAGAKAGPSAIKGSPVVRTALNREMKVTTSRGGIMVALPALQGHADITLCDIKGRQICRQQGLSGTTVRLENRTLAAGVYSIIVRANGQRYTRRVAVSGRGQ
jgi:hypothetical protein